MCGANIRFLFFLAGKNRDGEDRKQMAVSIFNARVEPFNQKYFFGLFERDHAQIIHFP